MLELNSFILRIGGSIKAPPMSEEERFWFMIIAPVIVGGIIIYFIYAKIKTRGGESWDNGIIPEHFKPTIENIFELFIAAAGAIVRRDLDNHYMKFAYVDKYLATNFRDIYYNSVESYTYSLNHALKIDSLASWSNKHLSKEWKVKLINFLAGLAVYDGGFNLDEKRHLLILMGKLNLEISDYEHVYREKLTSQNERKHQHETTYSKSDFFYKVLGLERTASIEEVRTTYRRLVKLTHPDRFMNESPEVQKQMSEKFLQVQEAYESIVNS